MHYYWSNSCWHRHQCTWPVTWYTFSGVLVWRDLKLKWSPNDGVERYCLREHINMNVAWESVCHECSFGPSALTQFFCRLIADRRLCWGGVKMIWLEKSNWWWGGLTAGEEAGGGERRRVLEEFDRKGLESFCPWSEVKPPASSLFRYISSWAATWRVSIARGCLISWEAFAAPCPRPSCKLPINEGSQIIKCALHNPRLRGSREHSCLTHPPSLKHTGCMQMKPSCFYMRAGPVIWAARVRQDN